MKQNKHKDTVIPKKKININLNNFLVLYYYY